MPTNIRDPRSFITPDAFEIEPALLGVPLARPWKRLVALLIDLAVIGILTALTSGLGVLIWGAVALILLHIAFRGPGERKLGQVTSVLFRGSTGCLGAFILTIVALMGLANIVSRDDDLSDRFETAVQASLAEIVGVGALSGLDPALRLARAESLESAESASQDLLQAAFRLQLDEEMNDAALAEVLQGFIGDAPAYTDDPDSFALEMVRRARESATPDPERPALTAQQEEDLATLDLDEVFVRYRAALEAGRLPAEDPEVAALRVRLLDAMASDTLGQLQQVLDAQERRRARAEGELAEARVEAASNEGGLVALLRDIWDQAGSAVGLWSIYFTLTLTLFQGFTVGKRIMGIRVVRLDGERFTWWTSFERGGGYVAGIATGLLGFAQVFWDRNRQCVHDKIVGTAVVVAGAPPVEGAVESAWTESGIEAS
jgi:uncharacterized RDD family membrane protein YckC